MSMLEEILGAQGGGALSSLAKQFGLDDNQASAALKSLVPELSAGMKKNIQSQGGINELIGALSKGNHQRYLDNPEGLNTDVARDEGNSILGHLLGSKDVSRQVASQAAEKTGLDVGVLKKMLPAVADMFMGATAKQSANLGLQQGQAAPQAGNLLGKLLDSDGDGSITDDLLGMAKKLF